MPPPAAPLNPTLRIAYLRLRIHSPSHQRRRLWRVSVAQASDPVDGRREGALGDAEEDGRLRQCLLQRKRRGGDRREGITRSTFIARAWMNMELTHEALAVGPDMPSSFTRTVHRADCSTFTTQG